LGGERLVLRPRLPLVTLLVVVLALILVPMGLAAVPNPCRVVTNAEVAKVFADKVQTRTANAEGLQSCTWNGVGLGSFSPVVPTLTVEIVQASEAKFRAHVGGGLVPGGANGGLKPAPLVRVHGVGQLAYSSYVGGETLMVWYHGLWLTFSVGSVAAPVEDAKILAKFAISRL
jgi:hypothetical protein